MREIQIRLYIELYGLIDPVVGLLFLEVPRLYEHSLLHGLEVAGGGLIGPCRLPMAGALVLVLLHLGGVPFVRLDRSLLCEVALHVGFDQRLILNYYIG